MQPREEKRNKALRERDTMFRRWRRWHLQQLEEARKGTWGEELDELLELLRTLTAEDGPALIDLVQRQGWAGASSGTKYLVLREIDQAITRVREQNGMVPIDSSLPWSSEPPTTFETIKYLLFGDETAAASPDSR
jgi:hypothetical protein